MTEPRKADKYTDEEIRRAVKIIYDCGRMEIIGNGCGGYLTLANPEQVLQYVCNPEEFRRNIKEDRQKRMVEQFRREAEQLNASFEDYSHYYKYFGPYLCMFPDAEDVNWKGGRCTGVTAKGKRCNNYVRFMGEFKDFKKNTSDRCVHHRPKRERK